MCLSSSYSVPPCHYLHERMTYNPLFTEKNTLDAILDYYTPFSLKLRILLSANLAKYIYHKWNWNMSYYCRMISVVRKIHHKNFITAKCTHINDGATLKTQIKFCTDLFAFQCVSSCPVTCLLASSYYYLHQDPKYSCSYVIHVHCRTCEN